MATTTTTITAPKQFVSIGRAQMGSTSVEVLPSPEFTRFLFDIVRRIGGDGSSMSIDGLVAALAQAEVEIDALQLDVEGEQIKPLIDQQAPKDEPTDGRIASLEAELATLRTQVEGLMQGYQL